ncbi:nucleoside hydrolase [Corynebacterium epidermidicanis]|uniref:Inosine-uridine nucleoside N-ribohydrolase n=1 Tax=Corynebacterium epidermidicanis TaxID=1050174 RepID=A0A0G3GTR7_9CORY|nr:nucleoside hydrolase [Corynebacterium epidermidicanis]AKK02212.1 Inosine-uridine nucleoside N-ribohydrolase [Corynebacterium epidermidicanis]
MVRILLDCDTGIDDALALMYLAGLHRLGEIELVGVTTTAGNTSATQAAINSHFVLAACGVTVPVAVGENMPMMLDLVTTPETHGIYGLGYLIPEPCDVDFHWMRLWEEDVDKLIVTGPATNAAAWGRINADVTLMGGAYNYPGNTTPTAEWNSWVDPHAAKSFFQFNSATVCSLGVTERFTLDPGSLAEVISALGPAPIATFLPEMLRFYFEFHQAHGEGYLAQIHDLITCMVALGKVPVITRPATIDVEASTGWLRGTTVADLKNHWHRPPNAQLVTDVDIPAAHRELLRVCELFGATFRY